MPNENTLEGIKCPDCEQEDEFNIVGRALFRVTDDGTDEFRDVEWDDDSFCECIECGFTGTIADFRIPEPNDAPVGETPK